ncbi:MAG: DMT family transporter [Marinifilaceae bacterium]
MNSASNQNLKGILFASITAFLWGFLAIALKVSLHDLDSITIVWFRFFFAFSVLFSYFLVKDRKQLNIIKRPPFILIVAALGLGLNYLGFLEGVNYTSPTNAQIIIQTAPILLGVVGFIFFKEKINLKQGIGFGIAGIGLFFFYRNQLAHFIHDADAFNKGFVWVETAAIAWVVYAALQKKLVQKHPAQTLNMVLYGIPALLYMPMADFGALLHLSLGSWLLLIFLGMNTLVAYGCIALAFKYTQAYKVSIIITLNPIITVTTMAILGYLQVSWIQAESLSFHSILGAIMVLGGAVIAVFFSRKNKPEVIPAKTSDKIN